MKDKIMELINKYAADHDSVKNCGSEYIMQSDEAQDDALQLVCDIFDLMVEEEYRPTLKKFLLKQSLSINNITVYDSQDNKLASGSNQELLRILCDTLLDKNVIDITNEVVDYYEVTIEGEYYNEI